jgi:hypothetical protein
MEINLTLSPPRFSMIEGLNFEGLNSYKFEKFKLYNIINPKYIINTHVIKPADQLVFKQPNGQITNVANYNLKTPKLIHR